MNSADYGYHSPLGHRRYWGIGLVVGLHFLVVWALVSGTARKGLDALKKPMQAVVIQEVIIPPAPPPPPPPPKELRPPEPKEPNITTPMVQPDAPVPEAARAMETRPEPPAAVVKPVPAPPLPNLQPSPPIDAVKVQAASMEVEYVGKVRAMLNSTKRYPTGRQASQQRPQGKVKVWFTLARNGALLDSGVLDSSTSNLLDDAALATVRRGTYPPFPTNTWPGEDHHKFSAEIEFLPPNGG
jgi:protein TonB